MIRFNKSEQSEKKFRSFLAGFAALKKKIPKRSRQVAMFTLVAILIISTAGMLWSFTATGEQEVENVTYYCLQEAVLDYKVYMAPNDFFEETVLEPGRAYMTELTEQIVVDFEYHYFGEDEAEISGKYGMTALLEARTSDGEHLVWDKEYELLAEESFSSSGSDYSVEEQVTIPFGEYLAFTEEVREETGYSPAELNLSVNAYVDVEAETPDGVITDTLNPNMVIPMGGSTFTVSGSLMEESEGGITEVTTVTAVEGDNFRAVSAVAVTLAAAALLSVRFLTVPSEEKQQKQVQQVSKILKKHKERIVVTANGVTSVPEGAITVYSFDELLKLADEVGKPIIYPQPRYGNGGDHCFLIFTPEHVYAYSVKEKPEQEA